jgi:hypothetical protein
MIRRSAVAVTVTVLVSGLEAELRRLGYKDSTLVWYRRCWHRLERFFAARGVEEFSLDVAMAWVDESCGFFEKERSGTLKANDVYLFRVAQMLGDYAVHGAVLRRYSRSVDKLSGLPWVWWRLPRFDVRGTGWSRLGSVCTIWGVAVKPGNAVIADSQSGSGRSCQTAPVLSLWRSQR